MRINELRDKIDKLGQKYDEKFIIEEIETFSNNSRVTVYIDYYGSHYTIATIMLKDRYIFSTIEEVFDELPEELQEELFNILVNFARTPADERGEEKKYQYRLKEQYLWIDKRLNLENCYLNIQSFQDGSKQKVLDNKGNTNLFKTEFTDEEIEEVVKEFDVDLNMFDKIEVE